jgi:hypothetical protein
MHMCEKCLKNFTSKQNLQSHGNVCKGHQILTPHKCLFCLNSYSSKQRLNTHLDTCKKKKEKNDQDKKKNEIQEIVNATVNKLVEKGFGNTIINNDNRVNITVVNNLIAYGCEPIDLSLERFDKVTDENYDFRTLTNFRIFPDIIAKFYCNDKGKICSYLSDADRVKIKSINEDCKIIIDDPESIITKYFSKSKVLRDRTNEFINNNDIMFHSNRDTINRAVTALSDRIALKKHLKKYKSNFITKNSIIYKPEIQIRFIE